jgi:hypothetical protein
VVEDGKLKIYRDVYDQDTNTEANLRTVLETHGVKLEDLSEQERAQVLTALNAMSGNSLKAAPATTTASPGGSPEAKKDKATTARASKPIGKNQKEVVIELAALEGKGYPTAVNFDTGSGKPAGTVAVARPTTASPVKKP